MKRLLIVGAAALSLALPVVTADAYQFIMSGDPNTDAPASRAESGGVSLATGTLETRSDATALEARYRTFDESDGTNLRSGKWRGLCIIVR